MKRYDHLYEKIYDLENLRKAHQHAKKGKGWYREVQEIDKDPDKYLKQIQEMLINHTYKTSDYEVFYKQDGKKLRKIYKLPYFPDRICQWAILQVIEHCIINNLTADTYSAIPNRGIHKGLTKLQSAMWNDPEECRYCLKLDARHYYQSINHDLLKEKYSKMFNDNELLWLLNEIIDSIETAEIEDLTAIYLLEEDIDPETGIPIGNYLSQYSGNYYFSSFDHWIKEQKHVKYYFRYMDDMVIFGKTKEELFAPLNDPAFWGNLSPMPFAQDIVCRLIDDGHLVRVVTSSYYNTVPPKMTWLFKHYPYLCWKDVIIAHDKKLINGDVLIDDGVHNLENAKYKKLLFDQPHNRSYNAEENGMIRVHDWNEIYRAICEIAGGEE